jgi:hypothetical protein
MKLVVVALLLVIFVLAWQALQGGFSTVSFSPYHGINRTRSHDNWER